MYGCSTAATIAASSSSSGEADSGDLVDSVRERVAELSGSESTSSMDPSDIDEDPGYRVRETCPALTLDIEDSKQRRYPQLPECVPGGGTPLNFG